MKRMSLSSDRILWRSRNALPGPTAGQGDDDEEEETTQQMVERFPHNANERKQYTFAQNGIDFFVCYSTNGSCDAIMN